MSNQYFFNKPETLASYIMTKSHEPSPVRLHKSLYLLYGYYAAFYGSMDESNSEVNKDYPPELIPAKFIARRFGPVLDALFPQIKASVLVPHTLPEGKYDAEVIQFIDELLEQINEASDFSLVGRVHEDKVWKDAYNAGEKEMENAAIKECYSMTIFALEE